MGYQCFPADFCHPTLGNFDFSPNFIVTGLDDLIVNVGEIYGNFNHYMAYGDKLMGSEVMHHAPPQPSNVFYVLLLFEGHISEYALLVTLGRGADKGPVINYYGEGENSQLEQNLKRSSRYSIKHRPRNQEDSGSNPTTVRNKKWSLGATLHRIRCSNGPA